MFTQQCRSRQPSIMWQRAARTLLLTHSLLRRRGVRKRRCVAASSSEQTVSVRQMEVWFWAVLLSPAVITHARGLAHHYISDSRPPSSTKLLRRQNGPTCLCLSVTLMLFDNFQKAADIRIRAAYRDDLTTPILCFSLGSRSSQLFKPQNHKS